ncbi:MAG: Rrf2 family transcriptional regulator, partial [Gallionella sp.]|nr:Rrf2 family transcriptional regulator [Gallionella sp.]
RLASAAEDITIEQVIKVTEESFGLVECFNDGQNRCTLVGACKLADVLDAALDAFFDVLRKTTLAELVENGAALEKMLLPVSGVNRVGSVAG